MAENRIAEIDEHKVRTGETIKSLAVANGMTWEELSKFNWGTSVPDEINKHLRDDVGCTKKTPNGHNYVFDNTDDPGIMYIPKQWSQSGLQTDETHVIRVRKLQQLAIHMHLDADRDGKVDDDRSDLDKWEWGKGKKGAIILANNDDDDAKGSADHGDSIVNGASDASELAPLVFRRSNSTVSLAGWKAELIVDDATKIRIFDRRGAGGNEIIGPAKGATYVFPDLTKPEIEFGMEATQYADGTFDGLVRLTFKVTSPTGDVHEEKGIVRVAPWIIPNHLDKAEVVYVVNTGSHSPKNGGNEAFRTRLATLVTGAGCSLVQHVSDDRWMQDCMELGYSNLPLRGIRAVMRPPRGRGLEHYPESLRAANFGFHAQGDVGTPTTFDSNGNLETTPPFNHNGKDYPFGRMYYGGHARPGREFDPDVRAFLEGQVVQKPIDIDTSWLTVGHVDEIVSFVPGGPKGFKMLLASPKLAYEILESNRAANRASKLLVGREFWLYDPISDSETLTGVEVTIEGFLSAGIPSLSLAAAELKTFNERVQSTLDAIDSQFKAELGLADSDIVSVPILFMPNESSPNLADALTAGMVNMLVLNGHCIFPKPFGPVVSGKDLFEERLKSDLGALGLTAHPIDDWYEYHIQQGEVHCGTNTRRAPTEAKWWEYQP